MNNSVAGTDKYVVDIYVSPANVVNVYVDGDNGISIQECVKISRLIESYFDRDIEDYELRVSSPGLDKPFKILRQYKKYISREIEVVTNDNKTLKGVLLTVSENGFRIERKKSKKIKESFIEEYLFDDIKEAKPFVAF